MSYPQSTPVIAAYFRARLSRVSGLPLVARRDAVRAGCCAGGSPHDAAPERRALQPPHETPAQRFLVLLLHARAHRAAFLLVLAPVLTLARLSAVPDQLAALALLKLDVFGDSTATAERTAPGHSHLAQVSTTVRSFRPAEANCATI
eukprot:64490-Prymnesium_polylepis.1